MKRHFYKPALAKAAASGLWLETRGFVAARSGRNPGSMPLAAAAFVQKPATDLTKSASDKVKSGLQKPLSGFDITKPEFNKPLSEIEKPLSDLNITKSGLQKRLSDSKKPLSEFNKPLSDLKTPFSEFEKPLSDFDFARKMAKKNQLTAICPKMGQSGGLRRIILAGFAPRRLKSRLSTRHDAKRAPSLILLRERINQPFKSKKTEVLCCLAV